jgi:hypothetical protein
VRQRKRNRCAPFCDPGLPAWAKLCRAPTKESGRTDRAYGAGRAQIVDRKNLKAVRNLMGGVNHASQAPFRWFVCVVSTIDGASVRMVPLG